MTIREKILIVEDEKSIAHFISTILTTNGYETILRKDGNRGDDHAVLALSRPRYPRPRSARHGRHRGAAQPARLVEPAGRRGVRAHA
ncbi:MAG: hypothetical protein ACLR4Z_02875 [Butyricicoccaceae bacterium]